MISCEHIAEYHMILLQRVAKMTVQQKWRHIKLCAIFFWTTLYTKSLWAWYLSKRLWEFHPSYSFSTIGDKDELSRFWGQKVKGQGHGEDKYGPTSLVQNASFQWRCIGQWFTGKLSVKVYWSVVHWDALLHFISFLSTALDVLTTARPNNWEMMWFRIY